MKCRKCHAEIPEESKFCMMCGAKQGKEEPKKRSRTRGNGQGSVFKRGNTWTAVWNVSSYVDENKKIHRTRRWKGGFKTKTDAIAYVTNPPEVVQPEHKPEKPISKTFRDYYELWERTDYKDLSKSKQTAYKIAWKRLQDVADMNMDCICLATLQDCVDDQTSTHYPARDMRTIISHVYERAVADGQSRTNLASMIRIPPLDEKELEPFTEAELKKMWEQYGSGNTFFGYLLLMVYSGMMPGELFGLKKWMIDFDAHEIRKGGIKTKKRKETPIVFPDLIAPVLSDLCEKSDSKVDNVLCMNKWDFYDTYHEQVKAAGIRDLPPYSCRHTTATALALGNIAPSVIQEIMRHTKFSTTQRYIHPDNSASHAAINTLVSNDTCSEPTGDIERK